MTADGGLVVAPTLVTEPLQAGAVRGRLANRGRARRR
jgi:hypothetical protein